MTSSEPAHPREPAPGAAPPEAAPSPVAQSGLLRLAGGFYGVVALFALGFALFSGQLHVILGTLAPTLPGLLGAAGVGLVVVGVSRIGVRAWPAIDDGARLLSQMLGPISRKDALLLALFSSVGEELLFRGALWGPLDGLVGTTCLFALVHIIPKRALWGYPLFAAGAGLLLGLLRLGTDSVFPPMVAHFVINALNLAWLGAQHDRFAREAAAKAIANASAGGHAS